MTSRPLKPTGRTISTDEGIAGDLTGESFRNHQFVRLVAIKRRFERCDFSSCEFESAYLRDCVFDTCNFTGARFRNSNLRQTKFEGCQFDYAEFNHTHIEPEILNSGLPSRENVQQKFLRSLRLNFQQIGDSVAANKAIGLELSATRVHLHKAWRSSESYYRKHHKGFGRVRSFFEWSDFIFLDFFWGNGESLWKLLRTIGLVIGIIAVADLLGGRDLSQLPEYGRALAMAPPALFGVTKPAGFSDLGLALMAATRYVVLACFVSILIKRMNRR